MPDKSRPARTPAEGGSTAAGTTSSPRRSPGPQVRPKNGVDRYFEGSARRGMVNNVLRTCMADKGYRRVEAPPGVRKELNGLDQKEWIDRLFLLAASAEPVGKVLPR